MAVIWGDDRDEHLARHGVTTDQANEALADPKAVVIDPDYASKTGVGIRTIGYSASFGGVLAVITVPFGHDVYGATAFKADGRDLREYNEKNEGV